MVKVSIITPTFNRERVLLRAIRSVQKQTISDYEHIIVDDGSTDNTAAEIRALNDDRIRYVKLEANSGANLARNKGVELARSQIVTYLDSDDVFIENRLQNVLTAFEQHPELNVFISSFYSIKHGEHRDSINPDVHLNSENFERALMAHAVCIAGSAISARLDAIKSVGGFTPYLARLQDRDFLLKLSRNQDVYMSSQVDWEKNESDDSISKPPIGYVAAFGFLAREHPDLIKRYPSLTIYHVARNIIRAILRNNWSVARSEYQSNLQFDELSFSKRDLVIGYLKGKKLRKEIVREISSKE